MTWTIEDWAGNKAFAGIKFNSFEDAEEYLSEYFDEEGLDYDESRGEYEIVEVKLC